MKGLIVATVFLGVILVSAPGAMAQTAPPLTLTGETLHSAGASTFTTTASCNPNGTSTFSYQTSGIATGPYTGTYTETGTVTVGPQPIVPGVTSAPGGLVTSWTASFTITSPTGNVTGTKTLLPPPAGFSADTVGICEDGTRGIPGAPNFPSQQAANNYFSHQRLGYTATITLATGEQFNDTGTSGASLNSTPMMAPNESTNNFTETYTSQHAATIPLCDENSPGDQIQDDDDQGCVNP